MKINCNQYLLTGIFLAYALVNSTRAFAAITDVVDECQYPALVTNLVMPAKFGAKNTTICVDIPVRLKKTKIAFDLDTKSYDGKGNAIGLKHMVMLGAIIKHRIHVGLIKPEDVSIIGVLHGAATPWALKKASAKQHQWINKIFNLNKAGVNIQLEACGVTMASHGWTKKDLFTYDANGKPDETAAGRIYVNQGAIGRQIILQQKGYTYIHEGYIAKK